jgi:hypothetical protein
LQVKESKPYTPFPPAQTPSKLDLQLESGEFRFVVVWSQASAAITRCAGEYFLSESAKLDRVREERKVKQEEAMGAKAKQVRCSASSPLCCARACR